MYSGSGAGCQPATLSRTNGAQLKDATVCVGTFACDMSTVIDVPGTTPCSSRPFRNVSSRANISVGDGTFATPAAVWKLAVRISLVVVIGISPMRSECGKDFF